MKLCQKMQKTSAKRLENLCYDKTNQVWQRAGDNRSQGGETSESGSNPGHLPKKRLDYRRRNNRLLISSFFQTGRARPLTYVTTNTCTLRERRERHQRLKRLIKKDETDRVSSTKMSFESEKQCLKREISI